MGTNTEFCDHLIEFLNPPKPKMSEPDYNIKKLKMESQRFYDSLPIQKGDRVRLTKAPKIEGGSGWSGSKHFLIKGAEGTVKDVDLNTHYDYIGVNIVFDDESWISSHDGTVTPMEPNRRHTYCMSIDVVEKIGEVCKECGK